MSNRLVTGLPAIELEYGSRPGGHGLANTEDAEPVQCLRADAVGAAFIPGLKSSRGGIPSRRRGGPDSTRCPAEVSAVPMPGRRARGACPRRRIRLRLTAVAPAEAAEGSSTGKPGISDQDRCILW